MPTISMFYGIFVRIFFYDTDKHNMPHIHAEYQGDLSMNIVEILPKENYVLHIKSDDGKIGLFDVKPYLDSEVFAQLKDRDEFERIHNGKYFVEWDCGADLSADTIQARWILTSK